MPRFPIVYSSTAVLALTASAQSQDITFWDLFTADRLGETVVQSLISTARGFAEVRFHDLDMRLLDGHMAMTGISVRPYDTEGYPGCLATLDELVLTSHPLLQTQVTSIRARISGANFPVTCMDPWDRADFEDAGIEVLNIEHGVIEAEYTMASGELEVNFHLASEGNGTLTGEMVYDYAAIDIGAEEPILDLSNAHLAFANDGLWERFEDEIPPFMLNAQTLTAMMEDELLADIPAPQPDAPGGDGAKPGDSLPGAEAPTATLPVGSPENEALRGLIAQAALGLEAFANDPSRIAVAIDLETPVRVSGGDLWDFPDYLRALQPRLYHGAPEAEAVPADVTASLAGFVSGDTEGFTPETRRNLARALLAGFGMPRNPAMAIDVLDPLLAEGDDLAVAMASDHLDLIAPDRAYAMLHLSAAGGNLDALLDLNAAEHRLGLAGVLAAQGPAQSAYQADSDGAAHVALARATLRGLGTPRSYAQAHYHALLGEAAGDPAAGPLVRELEDMGRFFDAPGAWADMLEDSRALAMADWVAALTVADPTPETSDDSATDQ